VSFSNISEANVVEYTPGVQTVLFSILLNPLVSSLLLIVGIFLLFIGIKTPGYDAEVTGSVCLILALIAFGVVGTSLGAVILFALGAILIIAELKTHIGVLALSGAICMVIASLLLFPSPQCARAGLRLRWMNILYELGQQAGTNTIMLIPSVMPEAGWPPIGMYGFKELPKGKTKSEPKTTT
jgi:membrane-bound ClpP family serine protease